MSLQHDGIAAIVNSQVHIHPDRESLSQAAAARFETLCRQALTDRKACHVALAGGSTPQRLYEILAAPPYLERLPWRQLHFHFGDERAVRADHPDSNYRMAHTALFSRVPVPAEQVHPMQADPATLEADARRYAGMLAAVLPATSAGVPRFDLVLLGMGQDGHTASLFPGDPALGETRHWVAAVTAAPGPHQRLTLTLPVLNAAGHLLVLVAGADKAQRVGEVLAGPAAGESGPPIARLQPQGELEWHLDQDAARVLT